MPASALIAVTGATGFLGRHLVSALHAAGHAVRAVVRSPEKARDLGCASVAVADLADADALTRAFTGCDAVIHNAALFMLADAGWDAFWSANVDGTARSLTAAADAGVTRNILISSTAVYGRRPFRRIAESTPRLTADARGRAWAYAISKAVAETRAWGIATERGLSLTALRPTAIYGHGDPNFTAMAERWLDRRIAWAPTAHIPLVHAADVAAAAVAAAERPQTTNQSYNLANEPESLYRAARRLRAHAGRGPWIVPVPAPLWIAYDTQAARRDLSFSPMSLDDGIARTLRGEV